MKKFMVIFTMVIMMACTACGAEKKGEEVTYTEAHMLMGVDMDDLSYENWTEPNYWGQSYKKTIKNGEVIIIEKTDPNYDQSKR